MKITYYELSNNTSFYIFLFFKDNLPSDMYSCAMSSIELFCNILNKSQAKALGITDNRTDLINKLNVKDENIKKYENLVNAIFFEKDSSYDTQQLYAAYLLSHPKSIFNKFDTSYYVNAIDDTSFNVKVLKHLNPSDFNQHGVYTVTEKRGNPSNAKIPNFDSLKENIKNGKSDCQIIISHSFNNLESLLNYICYNMVKNDEIIKICDNCGKYFYPEKRSDAKYCNNYSPQDNTKTCKEYGARKAYEDNLKNNECMALYRKIYMQKQMLAKRNSDIESYKDDFEKYRADAKQWKSNVKKGLKEESEFLEWLKAIRRKERD